MVQRFTDTLMHMPRHSHLVDYISVHIRFDLERYLLNMNDT